MTAYHGGKKRIGKKLAQIIYDASTLIEKEYNFTIKGYCEPFCGMLGVYQHIPKLFERRTRSASRGKAKLKYKAGDINKSVVLMWKAAQKGWKPPRTITKKVFDKLKYDGKYSAVKGFVGHVWTYRGIFFDGYFPHSKSKTKQNAESVETIAKQLKQVSFKTGEYTQYSNLKGYVIYCDPPYYKTNQRYYRGDKYGNRLDFDHTSFWNWCRTMSKNNIVFVSEYRAPKGIRRIWTNPSRSAARAPNRQKNVQNKEKLFML
jgi:site-specific DNA-adenine methylase